MIINGRREFHIAGKIADLDHKISMMTQEDHIRLNIKSLEDSIEMFVMFMECSLVDGQMDEMDQAVMIDMMDMSCDQITSREYLSRIHLAKEAINESSYIRFRHEVRKGISYLYSIL